MRRIRTLAAVAAAVLGLGVGTASAAHTYGRPTRDAVDPAAGAITALSVVPGDGQAEVVIALSGPVKVADFMIEAPDRIVLDLTDARIGAFGRVYDRRARGGIRNIRMAQSSPSVVRIVLDLDQKRAYKVSQTDTEIRVAVSGGERFVAWNSKGEQAQVAQAPAPRPAPAVVEPPKQEPPKQEPPKVEPPKSDTNIATGSLAAAPPTRQAPPPAAPPTRQAPPPVAPPVVAPVVSSPPPAAAPQRPPVNEIDAIIPQVEPVRSTRQGTQQRRITITWEDAQIADVLATFAEYSGRTIVRGKAVTGTVSAEIKDQPWDIAMKAILDAHGLAATEENSGIIVVDSYENILARQASEPLRIEMVRVNYVSAGSLVETVGGLLSRDCAPAGTAGATGGGAQGGQPYCITRGQVAADSGTNSLIITEVSSRISGLLQYISQLDVRTPQVQLKARIISVSRTSIEQLGLSYDLGSAASYFNNLIPRNRPGTDQPETAEGRVNLGGEVLAGMGNAQRKFKNGSALNLLFSTALGNYSLTAFLDALHELQLSDIQAEPSITTLDNREAKILVGEETPVRVIDAGAASAVGVPARANVQFKETGIILTVTPHITSNRQVRMSISAEQSELRIIGGDLGFTIPKRNATTQLLVNDGETAVIGGLTQTQITKNRSGIPLLTDLPLIGRLFSQTESREEKRDLLILITPHIIDPGESIRPPNNNEQN